MQEFGFFFASMPENMKDGLTRRADGSGSLGGRWKGGGGSGAGREKGEVMWGLENSTLGQPDKGKHRFHIVSTSFPHRFHIVSASFPHRFHIVPAQLGFHVGLGGGYCLPF